MNVGSLFTGIGGIDLGLEQAGHRIAWQCEADTFRRSVLAERFPRVECAPDVRELGADEWADPRSERPSPDTTGQRGWSRSADTVDLICGGFPCQDLSVAGRRAGLAGERSSLFFEFARIADALLAPGGWILLENVPGLLSSQGGRDYAVLLATLATLGFHDLAWRVLDSRHFGVAQRRRRVYIVARRARGDRACQVLLEPESSGGDPQTRGEAGSRATPTSIAGALGGGNDGAGRRSEFDPNLVVSTLQAHKTGCYRIDAEGASGGHLIADMLTSGSHPASNMPGRRREDDTNIVAAFDWQQGNRDVKLHDTAEHYRKDGQPAVLNGQGVRRLTPRECERLQGFPDDWTLIPGATDSKRYAALGDAVTVPVARWIGQRLQEHAA